LQVSQKLVKAHAQRGIYLTAVGFGAAPKDELLQRLADEANGNHAYIDSLEQAQKVFQANLPSTLQVLAQDAKIQVAFNPEAVSHYRLLGYEKRDIADERFRDDKVDAGEVGPGATVTVLYEILRHPAAAGSLGRIYLRYRDTGTRRVEEVNYDLPPGVLATRLEATSERFRFIACVAELAEILRGSYFARDAHLGAVLEVLHGLSPGFKERSDWKEADEMSRRAQELVLLALERK
jgi:Ca-activated chloride channel family protein